MAQIRKHRAGDRQLSARDWNNVADFVSGGVGHKPPPPNSTMPATVLVRNDTGADLDRFDCISLGEPLWTLEDDGSVDLIFAGEDADADKPAAILIEPIAHDATNKRFGRAWVYGLAYANVGPASSITDLTAAPDPANARLAPGSGNVRLLAAPSTTVETLLPVLLGGSGSQPSTASYATRLGFMGRDSANAWNWNPVSGSDGWVSYSDYVGTPESVYGGNVNPSEMGITVVAHTGGGVPADAERLKFANKGTYIIHLAWAIGVSNTGVPLQCETNLYLMTGNFNLGVGRRIEQGNPSSASGNHCWLRDTRFLKTTNTNEELVISIAANAGTVNPSALGHVIIQKI